MNTLRFVLLFLFAAWSGFLSANHTLENPYDSLAFVPSNQSGAKAYGILRGDLEKSSPKQALEHIQFIRDLSKKKSDKVLVCTYYETLAHYYSIVNDSLNALSTNYHETAVQFARDNALNDQHVRQLYALANYYFTYARKSVSYGYFREVLLLIDKYGEKSISGVWQYYITMGRYFYDIKEYELSRDALQQVLKYETRLNDREYFNTMNTLGLIATIEGDYEQANSYFKIVYEKSKVAVDSAWMGISYGNMGNVFARQNNHGEALKHFFVDYNYNSKSWGDVQSALGSLKKIAETYYIMGDYDKALLRTNEYLDKMERKPARYMALSEMFNLKVKLLNKLGLESELLETLKQYNHYNSLAISFENEAAIDAMKLAEEKQKFQALYSESRRNKIILLCLLVLVAGGAVVGLLYFLRNRKNTLIKEEPVLEPENTERYDVSTIIHSKKPYAVQNSPPVLVSKELRDHLDLNLMNDRNWGDFKDLFDADFPDFFCGDRR